MENYTSRVVNDIIRHDNKNNLLFIENHIKYVIIMFLITAWNQTLKSPQGILRLIILTNVMLLLGKSEKKAIKEKFTSRL